VGNPVSGDRGVAIDIWPSYTSSKANWMPTDRNLSVLGVVDKARRKHRYSTDVP
jgi:hypothetical protein